MYQKRIDEFSVQFLDKLREKLSYWLLNWAEKQKAVKETNWFLFELQQYRLLQRSFANTIYEQTRPPEGTKIEFISFRLVEVFHYEDFGKINFGLKKMFPDLEKSGNDFLGNFEKTIEVITTGLWHPVGTLYRDPLNMFGGGRVLRRISEIHSSIKLIDVDIQKILPSMIVVSFDVQLNKSATEQLSKLQSQKYLGKSVFKGITFGKYPSVNMSISSPESVMVASKNDWISTVRENVEEIVKPYLKGYFLSEYSNKHHLPSIETYILSCALSDQKNISCWAKLANHWVNSLGLNLSSNNLFGNDEVLFCWRSSDRNLEFNNASKVIVFSEKVSGQVNSAMQNSQYLINELIPLVTIVEFLADSQGVLEKIRRQIFSALGGKRNLSRHIKLYRNLQVLNRILQGLNLEIEQKMSFFGHGLFFNLTDLLKIQIDKIKDNKRNKTVEGNLATDGQERIKSLLKMLSDYIAFTDKFFSTHIELLNIDALYRLQKLTLRLTIIATIATIISISSNFSDLVLLFNKFREYITAILRGYLN